MVFKEKAKIIFMPEINLLDSSRRPLYKNQIMKTIETYPPEWKLIFEALQNSLDAIDKNPNVTEGKIEIVFDLIQNEVKIRDNGKGFPYDADFFFLGGGDKITDPQTKGNIGVGLKVIIFSTKKFSIESVFEDNGVRKKWSGELLDGYKFAETDEMTFHTVDPVPENTQEKGTCITYSFSDEAIIDFLDSINNKMEKVDDSIARGKKEKFLKALEHTFRSTAYSADVLRLLGLSNKKTIINLKIIYDKTNIPVRLNSGYLGSVLQEGNGIIEHGFENKFWDIEELISMQTRYGRPRVTHDDLYNPQAAIGRLNPHWIWIKKFTNPIEITKLLGDKFNKRFPNRYAVFLQKINGLYVVIGSLENLRKYFIEEPYQVISINGTPSDHRLQQPTGGEVTYSRDIFLLLDLKAKLNYGKVQVQTGDRKLIGKANDFYRDIYGGSLKKIAKRIVGEEEGGDSSGDFLANPETGIVSRNNLGIESSFIKEPYDENALIAIFFDLLGRGKLKNYEFYSLHSKEKYDGTAMVVSTDTQPIPRPSNDSGLLTVEFKLELTDLIDELEDDKKQLRQMHLIVVWNDDFSGDASYQGDYEIVGIEHTRDADRAFDGVTKCLRNRADGTDRQLLVLKEFIEKLKTTPEEA